MCFSTMFNKYTFFNIRMLKTRPDLCLQHILGRNDEGMPYRKSLFISGRKRLATDFFYGEMIVFCPFNVLFAHDIN